MKDKLIKFIEKELKIEVSDLLQKTKHSNQGDYSLPCFKFGKTASEDFKNKLNNVPQFLEKIVVQGPFLNFFFNKELFASEVIWKIQKEKLNFKVSKDKVLIEFPSPNTNKELHIGHTRNMLLGNSLSNLLEKIGNKVFRTNINNDRGIAICKTMISYKMFGEDKTPKDLGMKSDEFVSHWYSEYGVLNKDNKLHLDEKAQEMLVKWENGDKETISLWKKLMKWVYEGYLETYSNYKLKKFDREYYESKIYTEGRDIVKSALKKNISGFIQESDGAICYDFKDKTYGKKYLLRGDGTSLYMTQDLYLASLKEKNFKPGRSIILTGIEQKYHFEVLFKLIEVIGMSKISNNYHLAYGYVYDKEGKKFSSRAGNTYPANKLLNEIILKARKNLLEKNLTMNLPEKELNKRANAIGFSALSISFLKVNPSDDIKFDMDKALRFEGDTGPYVMYSYARIKSILRKVKVKSKYDLSLFNEREMELINLLNDYEDVVKESGVKYRVSGVVNYLIKLSQKFNEYYQNEKILEGEHNHKLVLIDSISKVLKDGLEILNVDVLEEM